MTAARVFVSALSPDNMGELRCASFETHGEDFLSALVSTPEPVVARLRGDSLERWTADAARLAAELASVAPSTTDLPSEDARKRKARNAIKAQIPALVPAHFSGLRRLGAECLGRQVVGLDFDHVGGETFADVMAHLRDVLEGLFVAVHTTATVRNADGTWRVRAYVLLDGEATPAEWDARVKPWMRSLGETDENALDVVRLLYCPIVTDGYAHAVLDGARLVLADLPAAPIAPPSAVRLTAASSPSAPSSAKRREAAAALLGGAWPATGRHGAQLALAGALCRDGWDESDAVDLLCDVCRTAGDEDRTKRMTTVRDTFARASSGSTFSGWTSLEKHVDVSIVAAARGLLDRDADDRRAFLAEVCPSANDTIPPVAAPAALPAPSSPGFHVVWGADLAKPVPPVPYLMRYFGIAPGRPTLLAGYGGVGKTVIAQHLGLHVAAGKGFCWGLPVAKGRVIHIDYEMTLDPVKRRYQRLALALGIDLAGCDLGTSSMPSVYLSDASAEDALCRCVDGGTLAFVDNLAAATATATEKENESGIRKYLDKLTRVTSRTGCTFVVLVHERKASKDEGGGMQRVRGSGAITDAAGSVISVGATEGDGIVSIGQTKASGAKKRDALLLKIDDEWAGSPPTEDDDAPGLTVQRIEERPVSEQSAKLQARIVELLSKGPQESKRKIEQALGSRNGACGIELDALVVRRVVARIPGRGFCLDTATARTARVTAAVAAEALCTHAAIAKAAHVDTDVVAAAVRAQVITLSAGVDSSFMVVPS